MNVDLAIDLWNTTPTEPPTPTLSELRSRQRQLERQLWRRDWLEAVVGALCTVFFGWFAAREGIDELRWDWLAVAAGCAVVTGIMVRERWRARALRLTETAPLHARLMADLLDVQRQERMLRNVLWWYVLPIELPMLFLALQAPEFEAIRWPFIAAGFVLAAIIVVLNRWVARNTLMPQRRRILDALAELDERGVERA